MPIPISPIRNSRGHSPVKEESALALRNSLMFGSSPRIVTARRSPMPGKRNAPWRHLRDSAARCDGDKLRLTEFRSGLVPASKSGFDAGWTLVTYTDPTMSSTMPAARDE